MNTTAFAATTAADDIERIAAATFTADHGQPRWHRFAAAALRGAAAFWLVMAVSGQLLFATYVAVFYGRAATQGRLEDWNKVLPVGYVPGDSIGNLALAAHLLFAVLITVGGALQLVPQIRRHWPRVHRINGRVYLIAAVIASVSGLIMVWTRKSSGDLSQNIAISINALLILGCAGMALRHAVARRLDVHRRWALRLFLAVSGVWFFRVGLMFWIVLNRGPVGFDPKTFTGPFLTFLSFAQYLIPLGVLQLYLLAQKSGAAKAQLAMAAGLVVLTLAMSGGIAAAAAMMWLPHM